MISLDDARATVLRLMDHAARPAPAPRPVGASAGLLLAEEVLAPGPVPPFAVSAMDGYALRAVDTGGAPVTLEVVGAVHAGTVPEVALGAGQALRIGTGAAIPPGADAVVPVEETVAGAGGGTVRLERPVVLGANVRPRGDVLAEGDLLGAPGDVLTPARCSLLASAGIHQVLVHPRLRVGVLSTGSEVRDEPDLARAQIPDANRPLLLATLARDGFAPVDLGIVPDDIGALGARLDGAVGSCDAVLTSGGVSVGERDVVRDLFRRREPDRSRWLQVAVKPGKPFACAVLGTVGVPVLGLPGNPVAASASYELLARPVLRHLAGHAALLRPLVRARAAEPFQRRPDGKLHVVLVKVSAAAGDDGELRVRAAGLPGSHRLPTLAAANGLVLLPDGEGAAEGDPVRVWLLDELS